MVRWDVRFADIQVLLCETEMRRGNLRQAFEYCKDEIRRTAGTYTLERIDMAARIFAKLGRYQEDARLSAATEALSAKFDWCRRAVSPNLRPSYWGDWRTRFADVSLDVLVPDLSTRIDREAILESWNAGRAMTYDETIVYVLNRLAI